MYAAEVQIKNTEQEKTEWTGTGFALKDGYVVTNYHVVENANQIRIYGVNGNFTTDYKAELIAKDTHNDLAILYITDYRFNGFSTIPYSINTKNADVGEEIFVLGYPLTSTMGDEIKLSTGIISSRTGYDGHVSLEQISAPIQPGNSGGPLLDSKGNIIGIVSSKHIGTENVGYAIKASYLKNIIESSLVKDILPNTNSVSHISFTEKVKKVKNYVFYVKCKK
jgi:S1-C subfamily serine protease